MAETRNSRRALLPALMPPRRNWLIGKLVGEYEVVTRIGEGGMGEVYEGRHPLIGKRVAIKTLLPQFSSDEALTQRFVAEARAVNAIRHRGIVDIFGFGKLEDGTQYCIMEFLEGMGFDALIQRNAPMASGEVVEYLDQIVDALGAAHAAGVIHRDIKPSNVFLVDTGHGHPYVKLLDFGIAKVDALRGQQTPQTRASMIMGTPDYMAPEQVRGEPVGAPTDFYALGCMVYHMLTGNPPYGGPNAMGSMFAHLELPVMRPGDKRPDLLPALDDLTAWMMQKAPEDRPPSATNLHGAIDAMWPDLFGGPHPPRRGASRPTLLAPAPRASPPQQPERATRPPIEQLSLPPLEATSLQRPVTKAPPVETRAHVTVDPLVETAPNPTPQQVNAPAVSPEIATDPVQPAPDVDPVALGAVTPRRWPLFVGLALFATGGTAGVLWFLNSRAPALPVETQTIVVTPAADAPKPIAAAKPVEAVAKPVEAVAKPVEAVAKPVEPVTKPVEPVAKPVEPVAKPVEEAAKPVEPAKADEPQEPPAVVPHNPVKGPPRGPALTPAMLSARLKKLDAMLHDREAAAGGELGVMRQLLQDLHRAAGAANDDASRRRVWSQMSELQAQLKP